MIFDVFYMRFLGIKDLFSVMTFNTQAFTGTPLKLMCEIYAQSKIKPLHKINNKLNIYI